MGLMFDTPTFELYADNGPLITRVAIAMIILSFIGVALRFLSRRLVQQRLLWDDWIIVIALPLSWIICILEIVSAKHGGLGRHAVLASPETIKSFFKDLYAVQLLYSFSIALTKFSILLFYRRVFTAKQTRIPLMIVAGVVGAWLIATSLVAIFSCTPIHDFWDRTLQTTSCINTDTYFMAGGATNIATDIAILLIPIPIIWKLQIFRTQKITILAVFLLGGFVIIVSCLRLVAIREANGAADFTWAWLPLAVWTTIETNVAIFCACIPCMRPLLRILHGKNVYTAPNEGEFTFPGRVHKRWWPIVRNEAYGENGDGNPNFLWLTDTNENDPVDMRTGTRTVISANRLSTNRMEMPELDSMPKMKRGILIEKKVMWT